MAKTDKTKIKRSPKRAVYSREEIYRILDQEHLCHVGITHHGTPVVIPNIYGRHKDKIYIHGASVSRLMTELEKGFETCVSIANVSGIVLARSAFNHSLNYESVVLFGKGKLVNDDDKEFALKVISDHLIKDRWEEVRPPSDKELKATKVIEIPIEEVSAKVRAGHPEDDKSDYSLDIWAGVIPLRKEALAVIPDEKLKDGIETPPSVLKYYK